MVLVLRECAKKGRMRSVGNIVEMISRKCTSCKTGGKEKAPFITSLAICSRMVTMIKRERCARRIARFLLSAGDGEKTAEMPRTRRTRRKSRRFGLGARVFARAHTRYRVSKTKASTHAT